ncbi:MAG: paraquat-inducible protein A [Pseudomonadota bacterium]
MKEATPENIDTLIACPKCDAVYDVADLETGGRVRCDVCHHPLITPRRNAGLFIIAMSSAALILVMTALFMPFISIHRFGFTKQTTILDAALAFSEGPMIVLALVTLGLIVGLPALRFLLTIYTLTPIVLDRRPWPGANRAFRLSEKLKPWSMVEIFVIGTAVALVKLTDLARVELGPAFWMFVALVILIFVKDTVTCRWTIWRALEE